MKNNSVFQISIVIIVSTLMIICAACSTKEPVADNQGKAKANQGKAKAFFEKFDKNKDGKVTEKEFPGPFERFDLNKDGIIDADEAPEGGPPGG